MKRRCYALAAIFGLFAAALAMRPAPKELHHDEAWVEAAVPLEIGAYRAVPGPDGSTQSYRMDDETYRILQPFGIVTRYYDDGKDRFDVAVVASSSRLAFHDPKYCLPSQDWVILSSRRLEIATRNNGIVPVTLLKAAHGSQPQLAAYCFQGPRGFVSSQADLYLQWSWTSFLTGEPQQGSSFRVLALDNSTSESEIVAFTKTLLESAGPRLR